MAPPISHHSARDTVTQQESMYPGLIEYRGLLRAKRFGRVFGGPFEKCVKSAQKGDATIRVAQEQHQHRATAAVEMHDFQTPPDEQAIKYALVVAVQALADGRNVFVGCMGGTGRTGLFMSCLAMALHPKVADGRAYARARYKPGAVETQEQYQWLMSFARRSQPFFRQLRQLLRGPQKRVRRRSKGRRKGRASSK
jgi:protein-tyrosine phosphatase